MRHEEETHRTTQGNESVGDESGEALLTLRGVQKRYGDVVALHGVDLTLHRGEVVVILGPSGCGKSTLLRTINGLEPIQGGEISMAGVGVFGRDVSWDQVRQKVGMVFQSYELFAHMNVIDNILLGPLKVQKRDRAEAEAEADRLLERVGLLARKQAWPRELSGGQKQRIAIVRALCMNPEVILLDEITAALDPVLVGEVLDLVREIKEQGSTILMATHEISFARQAADRVVFLRNGQIVEQGPPEQVIDNPRKQATRDFLARILH